MKYQLYVQPDRGSEPFRRSMTAVQADGFVTTRRRSAVGVIILNPHEATMKLDHLAKVESRLRRAGLRANLMERHPAKSSFVRSFLVRVFHLKTVDIEQLSGSHLVMQTHHHEKPLISSSLEKRLERIAIRALYTVGLDFGEVVLTSLGGSGFTVTSISALPKAEATNSLESFARFAKNELAWLQGEHPSTMLLGMDPEFLVVDRGKGKIISASKYLEHGGVVGCDAVRTSERTIYPIAEVRPLPASSPRELVIHLMDALRAAARQIPQTAEWTWLAGSMPVKGFSLGGHIHFSGIPLTSDLLRALDNYLALPMALIEDERGRFRRPRYGFLGDFRRQSHGGFEYRTLPSFLISPRVTKGALSLATCIANNYWILKQRPLEQGLIHEAFYVGNKRRLNEAFAPLDREIRALPDYIEHQKYLEPFLETVRLGKTWDESKDIRALWNLGPLS
ncbi:hypothetical protein J2Z69_000703 [Paenibacillus shirakamiensis]|uniref:PhiEco32-like amidoligase-type 2 protein n=1 Tax=Paenibacillus shirakamiensis TaxID=1265935 RepID=A0ABS4JD95_9BACL|nr:hypothetical protein [Paenibacillus shirakamiensis]MBP1999684.1 hypothetical protein [Paenibacillus shirakamiensis]